MTQPLATAVKRLALFAAGVLPVLAAAQTVPTVIGPIPAVLPPGTDLTHNYPQLASEPNDNLSARGYVEEEFFIQGTATRYATPTLADGTVISTGNAYKTRLIVRRPADASSHSISWVLAAPTSRQARPTALHNSSATWKRSSNTSTWARSCR